MLVASTVHAEWGCEAETGIVYDSNLSNSDRSADVRDDWAWRSDVSVNNGLQLTRDLRLNLGADVRGDVWDRFDAFNTVGVGASAGLRYRFGLGRQAPWIMLEDRFGYDRFASRSKAAMPSKVLSRRTISTIGSFIVPMRAWFSMSPHLFSLPLATPIRKET